MTRHDEAQKESSGYPSRNEGAGRGGEGSALKVSKFRLAPLNSARMESIKTLIRFSCSRFSFTQSSSRVTVVAGYNLSWLELARNGFAIAQNRFRLAV